MLCCPDPHARSSVTFFFLLWISSWPRTICWRLSFFSTLPHHLYFKSSKHMCAVCFWALCSIRFVCSCVRTTCLYYCWFVIRLTSGRAGSPGLFFVHSVSTSFGLFHYYIHFKFRWSGYTHTPDRFVIGIVLNLEINLSTDTYSYWF